MSVFYIFLKEILILKKITFKDKQLFKGFTVCGNMTHEQMTKIVSYNRIHDLVKTGYIQRISYEDKNINRLKSQFAYRLTEKGKNFCRNQLHYRNFANGRHEVRHQVACAEIYTSLTPEQRMHCMNDKDQEQYAFGQAYQLLSEGRLDEGHELIDKIRNASFVDLCVVTVTESSTEIACFEVITNSYSQDQIEAHYECATEVLHCTTYETINIH